MATRHLGQWPLLDLTDHPRDAWNQLWLLTEVLHEGKQPQVLEESVISDTRADDGFTQGYRNQFVATPWDVPYRPPLEHPKPRILGSQSAVVTGPAGEEIHCDQYGRVKVQSTGTATASAMTPPVAGCVWPPTGPAMPTAAWPSHGWAWKCW